MSSLPSPPHQGVLDLGVEVERDIGGIEMGILENGMSYLTQTGMAAIAGVQRSVIYDITQEWASTVNETVITKDRISFIRRYLADNGYHEPNLYVETRKDGSVHYAYPDIVCMAILEYYSFEARNTTQTAVSNYRRFAAHGLQRFIYEALNYSPGDKWKYYHDRVSILQDATPPGFFTIFQEITGLTVDLIQSNLTVNDKTIPDISVGRAWSTHWADRGLEGAHGERIKYEHTYPDYYPQSFSNPQRPFAYPDSALPEFRRWFRSEYLPTKFPVYILRKSGMLPGGSSEAKRIASMYSAPAIQKK